MMRCSVARGSVALATMILLAGCAAQPMTTVVPAGPVADNNPQSVTLTAVEHTLAKAPLPPGSKTATAAQSRGKQSLGLPVTKSLVDRHATFVVPLGFQPALAWFKANPPAGFNQTETASGHSPAGATMAGLAFSGQPTKAYTGLEEQVAIYPLGSGRAVVRIDALAIRLTPRTKAEQLPDSAISVNVERVSSAGAKQRRYTESGAAAKRLAAVLNEQPTIDPYGAMSCPLGNGAYDVLQFTGVPGDPTYNVRANGCGLITVTASGRHQPTLSGGADVDTVLTSILAHQH